LGETSKWVTMSAQRVEEFQVSDQSVIIGLVGKDGEQVNIDWAMPMGSSYMIMTAKCLLDPEGTSKLLINLDMTYKC